MRLFDKSSTLNRVYSFWIVYGSPTNFSYWWNFGSMALICLFMQIATGVFLAMHYKADFELAFASIDYINRNVNYGWFLRYLHANGSSMFFFVVYLHMIRNLFFGSFNYPRQILWGSGVIIFILMIATAFLGYVLPWGQMSFRAATVITSLFSAIPYVGDLFVVWLWGGFSIEDATLNRFFSMHFFFPFVILALSIVHLIFLHEFGSNNPTGLFFKADFVFMTPFYVMKDLYGLLALFAFFFFLIFVNPDILGHSDNYILSSSFSTPSHITPEWYFLPLYAVLRAVPNKLLGIVTLAFFLLFLLFLPFFVNKFTLVRSNYFKPFYKMLISLFVIDLLVLGWVGGQPVEEPFLFIGKVATVFYFVFFALCFFSGLIEQYINRFNIK
jgi:ubiquinol-cytochrome c reductase cytochrome b subunit